MKTIEERMSDLEQEVAQLRKALAIMGDIAKSVPETCGRTMTGDMAGWTTRCVLARGHAGQCDPTTRFDQSGNRVHG
jgi:hypothetical protein